MKKDRIIKVNFEEREKMFYGPFNDLINELKSISETLCCGTEDIQKERRVGAAHCMLIHIGEELDELSKKLMEEAKRVFILEQWLEKKGIIIPLGELRKLQKEWENKVKA